MGVFEWKDSAFKDAPHWSLPERYEFPWMQVQSDFRRSKVGYEYDD